MNGSEVSEASNSRETLDLAIENIKDVIVVVGPDGLLSYVSPSVRTYGHEPTDLIGRPSSVLLHPEDGARAMGNMAAALRGEKGPGFDQRQNRYRNADGKWTWLEGNPAPLRDANGAVVGIVNVLRDVTDHREQRDLFEEAFRHAAIGMTVSGMDGRFLRVNEAFCQMTGYTEAALMTTQVLAISHPTTATPDRVPLASLLSGKIDKHTSDRRFTRADGGVLEASVTVSMLREQDGSPRYFVAQVQDLTAQRAAEAGLRQTQERYRIIAENTSDMIVLSSLDGVTLHVSNAIVETGSSSSAVVGRNFADSLHPDDVARVRKAFGRLLLGKPPQRVRWRGRGGEPGDWLWMESAPSLVRDPVTGEPTRFLDVIRNVSAQVAQEEALEQARVSAEVAGEAKAQFLANMSHEIRTPLTAILGFANLLREAPELGEAAKGYVQRIGAAGSVLLAIVNDILDLSKLEAGKIDVRPHATDVATLAREALGLFSFQAEPKGLDLRLQLDPTLAPSVLVDPDRLRQILINLIGNAVKFTDKGSITVKVSVGTGDQRLRIGVRDTGPGLDPALQARLFQRFSQVDGSSTRQHGGTGLGLAISRGLVEAMGGEIGVTSQLGEGSEFWFSVPAPPAPPLGGLVSERDIALLDGARVLVVEDNRENLELVSQVLRDFEADVTEAACGEDALSILSALPMDVVLLDLCMPDISGLEALARLRTTSGPNRDVPVVALTMADVGDADLSGFDGVIGKPCTPTALASAIAQALGGHIQIDQDARNVGLG